MSKTAGSTVRRPVREILIVAVVVAGLLLAARALAGPRFAGASAAAGWLSQFEGGPVAVTFVKAPPGKRQVAEGRLISAEVSGLVLRFPKETDKFFCYANIISVDPK
ncbi:MAG: hypothetical protein JSW66_16405 [Phycisphaerales bacterium]|nr:MAG: hypothetical protein JSW66_16405 [Phycisphaerales bacterium]